MAETSIEWTVTLFPNGITCPYCKGLGVKTLKKEVQPCDKCDKTGIVYSIAGYTFNTHWGCVEQSAECDGCYAKIWATRWGFDIWGKDKPRRFFDDNHWNKLKGYNNFAKNLGEDVRLKVFVISMGDLFEKRDDVAVVRNRLFDLVTEYNNLEFLFLTKMPHNMKKMLPDAWRGGAPDNVWYGTTIGIQKSQWRHKHLIAHPAKVHFISAEPLLGLVKMPLAGIEWVISGFESGATKRPYNADWARSLRDQCLDANVPFFMKQMDKVQEIPQDLLIRQYPNI